MTKMERLELPGVDDLPSSHQEVVSVELDSELLSGQQVFSGSFTPGNESRSSEILIVPTAFIDGPHCAMQDVRNRLYSHATGLDILSIGTPSMATRALRLPKNQVDSYGLSERQREQLEDGRFTDLGSVTWRAIQLVANKSNIDLAGRKLHFVNYSMANSVVAGLLDSAPPELTDVGRIVLAEAPGLWKRSLNELNAAISTKEEASAYAVYESYNPDWAPETTGLVARASSLFDIMLRPQDHLSLAKGMAAGKTTDQLLSGYKKLDISGADVDIVFANAGSSEVSLSVVNDDAASKVRLVTKTDGVVRETWWRQSHGFCNDLGAYMLSIAKLLN